jgi:hypothetical protein
VIPLVGPELLTVIVDNRQLPLYQVLAERLLAKYSLVARVAAPEGDSAPNDRTVALRMPLRRRRSVLEAASARGCIAAPLPRDRRRRPSQPAGDVAHAPPLGVPDGDLLPVGERQIPPRRRRRRRPDL